MNTKTKLTLFGFLLVITLVSANVFAGTECSSQDCATSVSIDLGNAAPTIDDVQNGISVDLTQLSTTTVYVLFNVTDLNGVGELNDSAAQCVGYKSGESSRTSSSCSVSDLDADTAQYNCTISTFQYYDAAAADWAWNCSATDDTTLVYNETEVFTINALEYIEQDITTLAWTSASVSTENQESDAPIIFTNGGNQDYETCAITSKNATFSTDTINDFEMSPTTADGNPDTVLVVDTPTAISSWFTLNHGDGSTETAYAYVDIGSVMSGTYETSEDWLIAIS